MWNSRSDPVFMFTSSGTVRYKFLTRFPLFSRFRKFSQIRDSSVLLWLYGSILVRKFAELSFPLLSSFIFCGVPQLLKRNGKLTIVFSEFVGKSYFLSVEEAWDGWGTEIKSCPSASVSLIYQDERCRSLLCLRLSTGVTLPTITI